MAAASSLTSRLQPQTCQLTPKPRGCWRRSAPHQLLEKVQPLNPAPPPPQTPYPLCHCLLPLFLAVTLNFPQQMCHILCHHWNTPEQRPSQPTQDQSTRRWPGLEDAPGKGSMLRTVTVSPMDSPKAPLPRDPSYCTRWCRDAPAASAAWLSGSSASSLSPSSRLEESGSSHWP